MRWPLKLDVARYRDLLAPLYVNVDPASRWDYAERLTRDALRLIAPDDDATREADPDTTAALAYAFPVRAQITPHLRTRTAVEAFFVGQGWAPLRCRELLRGLERLPDKPATLEEQLVADAETLSRLGLYGLSRALVAGAVSQQTLAQSAELAMKQVHRRAHTRTAQAESVALRTELRELAGRLLDAVKDG